MPFISIATILFLTLSLLISAAAIALAMRTKQNRHKPTPYECGFEPTFSARSPFSARFFLLAVIFLVFDVEIILLFPSPLLAQSSNLLPAATGCFTFLIILIIALTHEWLQGALEWMD